ncbi:MAG: hypothetical protein GX560_03730 [Deinococcales bacterium]|nr:hypothetical protein [Deinococcales bacterium]
MDDQPADRSRELPPSRGYDPASPAPPLRTGTPADEEVRRIDVDPEDRLAFRVGVNVLTLILIGVGAYLVWRYLLR